MIIDFHTHMFPDKIAKGTLDFLTGICKVTPFTDGTYAGLCKSTEEAGISLSVALPAVPSGVCEPVCRKVSGRIRIFLWRNPSGL